MDNLPINITDIIVIIVLLVSAFLAYARGFVHEVLSVGGWIGAGFITIYGFKYAQPYARNLFPENMDLIADLVAGVVLFVLSLAILSLLTNAIAKRVQDSALNPLDRSLGFLFGLARGVVIICFLYLGYEKLAQDASPPTWLSNARTMPIIKSGADWLKSLIPGEASDAADNAASDAMNKAREESQKVIEGLISPAPKSGESSQLEGYGKQIRTEMERLIDSSSQQ